MQQVDVIQNPKDQMHIKQCMQGQGKESWRILAEPFNLHVYSPILKPWALLPWTQYSEK